MTRTKLSKYVKLGQELQLIDQQLSQYRYVADTVRGSSKYPPYLSHTILITGQDDGRVRRLRYRKYYLVRIRKEIEGFIDSVPDGYMREILRARYIDGATWEQVVDLVAKSATSESLRKLAIRYLDGD